MRFKSVDILAGEGSKASTQSKSTLLTDQGRPPWYLPDGTPKEAFVIGVAGGSGSGKTTVANAIREAIDVAWILVVPQDSFYKSLSRAQSKLAFANNFDFDSPDAFDYQLLRECISDLKACRSAECPTYSFVQHQRTDKKQHLYGATIVIIEGIFVLYDKLTRDLLDLKIFVQCDSDLMLARRIARDVAERGRDVQGILSQYLRFVKPSYDDHVLPTSKHADIIVPGSSNHVAIDIIATHIRRQMDERSFHTRSLLCPKEIANQDEPPDDFPPLPKNIHIMEQTNQLNGIMTVLRDTTTAADDFIFFADRLATLLVEQALRILPYADHTISTGAGHSHPGKKLDAKNLCGLTILRSGACLERGLRRVQSDIQLGSVLIQSEPESGEPLMYQLSLPTNLKSRASASKSTVLVLDSQIGTGAAALMAIRILLDHGVPQENIVVVVFLISRIGGVHAICKAFPGIRIVTAAADPGLEEHWIEDEVASTLDEDKTPKTAAGGSDMVKVPSYHEMKQHRTNAKGKKVFAIVPGLGSFGQRYFGA